MANNADCRICGRTIRGFDDICLSCWNGFEESEPEPVRDCSCSRGGSAMFCECRLAA